MSLSQAQRLSQAQQTFILHWGEMGTKWGINRTVAQIHALLYLSSEPLHAEAIASTLSVARSNVSTSLRELQTWGLVKVVHVFGDRRDHFETEHDVWTLFRIIIEERKKREIDPTIQNLRQCLAKAEAAGEPSFVKERLQAMLDFFEQTNGWYETVDRMPNGALQQLVRMGDRLPQLLGLGRPDGRS